MTAYHGGIGHAEGGMVAAQLHESAVIVEDLWVAVAVCPVDGVDVVGRLEAVVYAFLVAQHFLAGIDEGHALGCEDGGLSEQVEAYQLVGGYARYARLETVDDAHVVVA